MDKSGKHNILIVSGFVCDTYSQIEKAYIDLSSRKWPDLNFIWVAPGIGGKYNRYKDPENRLKLKEPLYVSQLMGKGISFVTADISKYNFLHNYLLFRKLFKEHHIDAVYTHFGFERFYTAFFAKLAGKKVIWHEHWLSMQTRRIFYKSIFYRVFIDRFIAISKFISSILPVPEKVSVVLNSIDTKSMTIRSKEEAVSMKASLGIDLDKTVILMVAAFRPDKRHEIALRICRKTLELDSGMVFIFTGDGPTKTDIERQIIEQGLTGSIVLTGHTNNIGDYYSIADICMLTSNIEGCAMTMFESMVYSIPMIAFASGGTTEVLENDFSGVLIPDNNIGLFARKLYELAKNPEKRNKIGKNANFIVRTNYSRSEWENKIVDIIRKTIVE